ncbi:MAG: radical SAM protein [Elusimicrobiota bacterium]
MRERYSSLKALRYPAQLRALAEGGLAAPVHVRIKPINACNHHCWYCAYRADNLELGSTMELRDKIAHDKMDEIVGDLIAMGVKAVTFSGGGEPLLYPRLPQVVERLAKGGVRVATLTNGALLKGAAAEAFNRHGTWARVSIDAWDGPSYARSRGVGEDEYDKVMKNLSTFARLGSRCALGISFIVGKDNAEHIADFCRQAKEAGISSVKFSGCVVSNSGRENNEYHAVITGTVRAQLDAAGKLADKDFKIIDHYHALEERFDKVYTRCAYLQFLTVIGADCVVYTCQDKAYTDSGRLGSIKDRSFKDFWFSNENKARMKTLDPSRDCTHHCVSHSKNLLLEEYLGLDPDHADFV